MRILFVIVITFLCQYGYSQKKLKDGLYVVDKLEIKANYKSKSKTKQVVHFNKQFTLENPAEYGPIVILNNDFVPLELAENPETQQQTDEKKLLLLKLTKAASEKLKTFSTKNLMKHVAIIVNGEALTVHKIKEPLTSGMMQITRCTDNACEQLYKVLKDNVK